MEECGDCAYLGNNVNYHNYFYGIMELWSDGYSILDTRCSIKIIEWVYEYMNYTGWILRLTIAGWDIVIEDL